MKTAPKSHRLHLGLFGRRNAGKSSLLNAMTRQEVSIVSEVAGTTTDPVEKPMEMLPLGPVLWIDTAGVDDSGVLGEKRVEKTLRVFDRTDVGILVVDAGCWEPFEEKIFCELRERKIPVIVALNKSDLAKPSAELLDRLRETKTPFVKTVAFKGSGAHELREALIQAAPEDFLRAPPLVADLVPAGELAVLVVPIDMEAPKGRLIMPQVQAIRDLLDGDAYCLVVKERELREALNRLNRPPALVVTDSQAFLKVSADTPLDVKMTSFSILMARQKGDLGQFVEGALAIERLRPGDRVLVAEACTHHPIGDDIGRVKIPRWLKQFVGGELEIDTLQGRDFPDDLDRYQLVVHCGACVWNRREMLSRMARCRRAGVPICNYGMTIAYTLGIFDRALTPFPDALEKYRQIRGHL
ncbi:MAG: [FeFe] hydrogenase H-cluster maturation GTPase HydF [Pirellulales bacterium]|nr:[FeFe] hydrogenase H-cluster maturation GTPase HydF [Pirellulales bacterium]